MRRIRCLAYFPEGIAAQTKQSLTNVKAILAEAGTGMDQVIKTTVFLSDMNNFGAMNEVYATFFGEGGLPGPFGCGGCTTCPRTLSSRLR